eukprot:6253749-Ditylum_brightwellii.AAC.1
MLIYLAGMTHPDISMPVHQCVWYSHNPWRYHEKVVKHIVHYLISTKDTRPGKTDFCGMIIDLMDDLTLDCYCDASFAGLWGQEDDQNP